MAAPVVEDDSGARVEPALAEEETDNGAAVDVLADEALGEEAAHVGAAVDCKGLAEDARGVSRGAELSDVVVDDAGDTADPLAEDDWRPSCALLPKKKTDFTLPLRSTARAPRTIRSARARQTFPWTPWAAHVPRAGAAQSHTVWATHGLLICSSPRAAGPVAAIWGAAVAGRDYDSQGT